MMNEALRIGVMFHDTDRQSVFDCIVFRMDLLLHSKGSPCSSVGRHHPTICPIFSQSWPAGTRSSPSLGVPLAFHIPLPTLTGALSQYLLMPIDGHLLDFVWAGTWKHVDVDVGILSIENRVREVFVDVQIQMSIEVLKFTNCSKVYEGCTQILAEIGHTLSICVTVIHLRSGIEGARNVHAIALTDTSLRNCI
eukprot:TRINITY_DN93482_c0_g1_i1.p2 TRINITY_DN93482_c0_g1~~TRINITY_DN93482_c0_g1_i1.p2  ORF type:complete len:194 (+),score=4.93 TRINITY_DN93482_c0_g1_i1:452-1033(+)